MNLGTGTLQQAPDTLIIRWLEDAERAAVSAMMSGRPGERENALAGELYAEAERRGMVDGIGGAGLANMERGRREMVANATYRVWRGA